MTTPAKQSAKDSRNSQQESAWNALKSNAQPKRSAEAQFFQEPTTKAVPSANVIRPVCVSRFMIPYAQTELNIQMLALLDAMELLSTIAEFAKQPPKAPSLLAMLVHTQKVLRVAKLFAASIIGSLHVSITVSLKRKA